MPGLKKTLSAYDLDFLTRIARVWRIEINTRDLETASADLLTGMLDPENLEGVLTRLDDPSRQAWEEIASKDGHIPWAAFSRKYGAIRSIGPARRERENPDLNPGSTSEKLWYSGLVGRAFLKLAAEPEEFVYIPDEFIKRNAPDNAVNKISIRPAVGQKPSNVRLADSSLLDHLTDMLSAARMGRQIDGEIFQSWGVNREFLDNLLKSSSLLNSSGQPEADRLKDFFQKTRSQNLHALFQLWFNSRSLNDLRMLPALVSERAWNNDPLGPRQLLAEVLSTLQGEAWWSISSLLASVKEHMPDFQRPAGDYDSWFIREQGTENYLRGFQSWDQVEGALLKHLMTGAFHWFGARNLAFGAENEPTAFQLTTAGREMLRGEEPKINNTENQEITVKGVSALVIPVRCSRIQRYQVARFCEMATVSPAGSIYHISPASLHLAIQQGLTINQLVQILNRERTKPLPTAFTRMAERWQAHGLEATIQSVLLMRFSAETACSSFLAAPGASRLKIEQLTPTTVIILREQMGAVQKVLAELGILVEIGTDV